MASEAVTDDTSTKWADHVWSLEAVSAAITKSTETIKLSSKRAKVVVSVHRELLCFFSSYFSAALNGKFLEAQKDYFEVELLGQRLKSFVTWIYTGGMTQAAMGHDIDLYVFSDQVDIMALRRAALNQVAKKKRLLAYDHLAYLHQNLAQTSPLLRYTTDFYIAHWEPSDDSDDPCCLDDDTDPDHLLAQFLYQVLKGVATRRLVDSPGCPCCNDICRYHEHSSKEEWEATCGQLEGSKMPTSLCQVEQLIGQDDKSKGPSSSSN
ncbi:hypothetical protein E4T50_05141 [Aureobasidium sp. EXF-12298]|nr:hypothetical protein E4T50_05141 [Aureobasidium sp. EXF-12298]